VKRVSVEQAFLWAQAFVAREWRLLVPVALAFMALPPLLVDLIAPDAAKAVMVPMDIESGKAQISLVALLLGLGIILFNCIGQLSLVALGLVGRISVREAIGVAFARLPILVATGLITFCVLMLAAVIAAVLLNMSGLPMASQRGLLLVLIFGLLLFLWIRLIAVAPLIVAGQVGPILAIRRAWDLSRGTFWRIAAALVVYLIGATVVVSALSSALGAMLTLGAKAMGQPELGLVLANVLFRTCVAIGGAGLQIVVVAVYRQLAASRSGA
jgi:hypothetical protein